MNGGSRRGIGAGTRGGAWGRRIARHRGGAGIPRRLGIPAARQRRAAPERPRECPRVSGARAPGGHMRLTRWNRRRCVLAMAGLAVAALAVPGLPAAGAAGAAGPAGPQLRLIAAQHSITLDSLNGQVYLDPGMWVAATGSPLQFDVR